MKIIQLFALLLILPLGLIAQEGTSLEEYRYLSKGYAYQQEMGLDANKAGYTIQTTYVASNEVKIVGMYKQFQTAPQGLLFIVDQKDSKSHYICLPNNQANERVQELFANDFRSIHQYEVKQKYELALREYLFASLGQPTIGSAIPSEYSLPQQDESFASSKTAVEEKEVLTSKGGIPDVSSYFPKQEPTRSQGNPVVQDNHFVSKASIKIGGHLSERNIKAAPSIKSAYASKGKVVLKVCVNQIGEVTSAKFTQRGSTTFNAELKHLALDSAKESLFVQSELVEQCGTISYHFK